MVLRYVVSHGILCHHRNFSNDTSYEYSEQILSWMMDDFIHRPKPDLLLSPTCDEVLPWMIEIWMKVPLGK
jgi:hypothetical protein